MNFKISIICSVRNCLTETAAFLSSLKKHSPQFLDRVIILDDGSDQETKEFLSKNAGFYELYRNEKSKGFAFSNNFGVSKVDSEWILFMNNDLVLPKEWSKPFESIIEGTDELKMMGCLGNIQTEPVSNKIDHAGVVFKSGIPEHFLKGENSKPEEGYSEFLAVTGACFMIRRELFLSMGGFDETYRTGFEDIDLCLRLGMLGYRHYVANRSEVVHKRSSTPERNQFQKHNSKIFYTRWGKLITRFQEWESARENDISTKTNRKWKSEREFDYVLKRRENFLFADRKVLDEYFQVFLKSENLEALQKVFSILEDNFVYDEDLFLKKAQLFQVLGEAKNAKKMLESLLKKNPRHLPAILNLGQLLIKEKARPQALEVLRKAKVIFPGETKILLLMCRCKWLQGRIKQAKNLAQTCVLLDPNSFGGWSMLARIARKEEAFMEEVRILKVLLKLKPNDPSTVASLLQAYSNLQLCREIWQLCRQQTQSIQSPESLLIVAHASYLMGDFKLCKFFLMRMGKLGYENEEVLLLEGNLMVALKQFARAVYFYTRALEFAPNSFEILSNLANAKSFLCDWKTRQEEVAELQSISEQAKGKIGAFEILGLELNEKQECKLASLKAEDILSSTEKLRLRLSFSYGNEQGAKKRIGFLSSDFRNHAVGHQMIALLENLDAEKYEIFLYASNPSVDSEIRKRFVALNQNFRDVSNLSLAAKARCINRDKLDLLVDLGGFSRGHNAEVLALRPSVRQAHYLGYASSMGKGLVDYMIADRFVIPPKSSKDYGEKIIRMDGCFFPPGDFESFAKRSKRKEVGLPSRGFVYCAFHAAYKVEPEIWVSWMRILRAVPESVLWLKFKPSEEALKNLRSEAVRQGVSSKRIIMAEDIPVRSTHLSRMTVADLYLDCPKYNGHASAMDALHAKLPILTIKGNRFCNRVGESFCRNLGLGEMVSNDLKQYEKKAIELGLRPSLLLPLRKKIQENVDSVLSPVAHAQRFQQAIDQIVSLRIKVPKNKRLQDKGSQASAHVLHKLEDFTLVMIRPLGITNWASNVNFLAEELAKFGGKTIVIEPGHPDHKKGDFSKHVKRLPQFRGGFAEAMNYALTNVSTKFVFFLDDPLRALPANHFIEVINQAKRTLSSGKIGFLGIGSSMEPNTGVLVTKGRDAATKKVAGLFAPSFALNLEGMRLTGGFRTFGTTAVLSCLDLSLRLEEQGWKSVLIETEKLLCPASSGKDYLHASGKQAIAYFGRIWKRKPLSLNPKFPPKEEQVGETADYQEWIRLCDTITEGDILSFRKEADELQVKPLISVVMPVFDPPKKFLIKAIESVISQAYENWELCIADDASTKKYIRPLFESYARKDSRIKVTFRKTNGHISVASNSALKLATGEFVAFLDHDDELGPHSLLEVAKVINRNPNAQLIYSDEDKVDEQGGRYEPYFKPDWNPDLLLGQNYISHLSTFKTSLVKELKGLRKGFEGAQDWDLTLRITERLSRNSVIHIPKVLYHWRAIAGSTAKSSGEKNYISPAVTKNLKACLERRKLSLQGNSVRLHGSFISHELELEKEPFVSVLIPIKDKIELLVACLNALSKTVQYKNLEIIILDNESKKQETRKVLKTYSKKKGIRVIQSMGDFNFSRINNIGSREAKGEVLLFLNNDVFAHEKGWFESMLAQVLLPKNGCVGIKLLYPDEKIQHAGVVLGLGGIAGHAYCGQPSNSSGYYSQLSLTRNVSAVTAACLMVKSKDFIKLGGFNENLKVNFNDVDFCLRAQNSDLDNIVLSTKSLFHLESKSRGKGHLNSFGLKFSKEISHMENTWKNFLQNDPNTNVNLTPSFLFSLRPKKIEVLQLPLSRTHKEPSARNQYKETWDDLSTDFDSAKFHVTGDANEKELYNSSIDTISRINRNVKFKKSDVVLEIGCGIGRVGRELAP
ncbi:MAG: glycosyltransferase, partial [Opitutales bacterium]